MRGEIWGGGANRATDATPGAPFPPPIGVQCIPQRAALLKSMLNFLKKAIQDPAFSDGIRHGEWGGSQVGGGLKWLGGGGLGRGGTR